ncbi:LMBR1 domain-containing protein 2 [Entophlyctis sp. JEL0112]|nr:LMBR1 domain-containing protein 2 [Entophlyctis sp. JEL0112]
MLAYVRSGDFTIKDKVINAVRENLYFYAFLGVLGVAFLIYMIVAIQFSREDLTAILIAAANAWGLLLCTVMLGYGLVEIPRDVWNSAISETHLTFLHSQIPGLREKMIDSEAAMFEVARQIARFDSLLPRADAGTNSAAADIPDAAVLRKHVDSMVLRCPLARDQRVVAAGGGVASTDQRQKVTLGALRKVNADLKYFDGLVSRYQAQYRFMLEKSWFLSDVVENAKSRNQIFQSSLVWTPGFSPQVDTLWLRFLWFWYVWIKPILIRAFAVVLILASVALVWSESTFQVQGMTLSIPALLLQNNVVTYASLEFISISFLVYMCTCTYSTLFRIKIFEYYVIVPEHCTDEPSMLFMGAYLWYRLIFPLCYNFLNMVGDDENSVFIEYQGKAIDLTPLLGDTFNTWTPLLVLLVATTTYFDVIGRIISLCSGGRGGLFSERRSGGNAAAIEGRDIAAQARTAEDRRRTAQTGANTGGTGVPRQTGGGRLTTKDLLARYNARGDIGSGGGSDLAAPAATAPLVQPPPSNSSVFSGLAASASGLFSGFGARGVCGNIASAASTGGAVTAAQRYHRIDDDDEGHEDGNGMSNFVGQSFGPNATAANARGVIKTVAVSSDKGSRQASTARVFGKGANSDGGVPAGVASAGGAGKKNLFADV